MPVIGAIGTQPEAAPAERARRAPAPAPAFQAALRKSQRSDASAGATPLRTVAARRTQLSGQQAADALRTAWQDLEGDAPSSEAIAILTAQWSHETGQGRSMFNFNFGGIKGTSPEGLATSYRTHEGWGATRRRIVDNFRAYTNAAEGAQDYIGLLQRRYPAALDAARRGDPAGFVHALKAKGYFTGNEQAYVKSVTRLANRVMAHGYDAVGSTAGALSVPTPAHFAIPEMAPSRGDFLPASIARTPLAGLEMDVTEIDVYALADEVSRAALRIASDQREDDRDRG